MAYEKTIWVNDGPPALSATNLNKLETQYDEAKADLAAHQAEKATEEALGHVRVDGNTIAADTTGVIGVPSGLFMSGSKEAFTAEYTDNIGAGAALTKNISIGAGKRYGILSVSERSADIYKNGNFGVMVFFSTDTNDALMVGHMMDGSNNRSAGATSRRRLGTVTTSYQYVGERGGGFGVGATDGQGAAVSRTTRMTDVYLSGNGVVIKFANDGTSARRLSVRIDGVVW